MDVQVTLTPIEAKTDQTRSPASFCFSILSLWSSPPSISRDNTLSDTLRNFAGFSVIKISAGKQNRTLGKRGDQHHTGIHISAHT